ncbi:four helix bundle protein [Bacillus sp. ISL-55]|uniref:four helix bundle protein n=1 Tax=Bacillus sp. ISL-55 TaxID=2819134 RepID=UPI001BE5EC87|nr:four helix bundle protein [Bacillus sp. ISL-55]MBT2694621.1 four helix bundle protein [Bacillus sp. ISL-55]
MATKKEYVGNFRELIAYKKALLFRRDVYTIIKTIPSSESYIKNGMRKASCAVLENLAEGNGNFYYGREYEHFDIALCKLAKYQALLDLSSMQGYVTKENNNRLQDNAKEIARIISALMKRIEHFQSTNVETHIHYSIKDVGFSPLETTIERVKIFQRTIGNMVRTLPDFEVDNIVDQLNRAVSSVYNNLVKSKGVISNGRFQELNYALGSISEICCFLEISFMENYISKSDYRSLDEEAEIIRTAIIKEMKRINYQLKEVI